MEATQKAVIISRTAGDIVVFEVKGELSRWTSSPPTLSELVKTEVYLGTHRILIDFENTKFVDSFGIGEVVASYASVQNSGGTLKVCRLSDALFRLFKFTMIDKIIDVYPTEEAAREAFAKPPAGEIKPKP